jgi:Flp pilus assembly protein TadG
MVETIIVTPLLLFLILVTAEITNAFVEHNRLSKAARIASRYLSSNAALGTTGVVVLTADVVTETRNLLVFGNTTGTGTPILNGLTTGSVQVTDLGNDIVQVTVTYPYTGLLGGSLPSFGIGADPDTGFSLQASVSMRAL